MICSDGGRSPRRRLLLAEALICVTNVVILVGFFFGFRAAEAVGHADDAARPQLLLARALERAAVRVERRRRLRRGLLGARDRPLALVSRRIRRRRCVRRVVFRPRAVVAAVSLRTEGALETPAAAPPI